MKSFVKGDLQVVFEKGAININLSRNQQREEQGETKEENATKPSFDSRVFEVQPFTVEGVMKYCDELYEQAMDQAKEEPDDKRKKFYGENAEHYKAAAMALRTVLKSVDEWEKENGPGSAPAQKETKSNREKLAGVTGNFSEVVMDFVHSLRQRQRKS